MSYVKSSDTETWTEYNWLERHVAGHFRLFEEFPTKVEFDVVGLGKVEVYDYHLNYDFENEMNIVWMVFKINGKLFKVNGSKDSYGGSDWSTELKKVTERKEVEYLYV